MTAHNFPRSALLDLAARVESALGKANSRLGGVEIEQFGGDNFAVWLCSQFDDPDDIEEDECGWGPTAIAGYESVMAMVMRTYADELKPIIADLRARAEASND